jgi:hypothetical protein
MPLVDQSQLLRFLLHLIFIPRSTHFLGVVHVVHWRSGAPVHHTVHGKVRTYQIAITRYFDLVALHPFF